MRAAADYAAMSDPNRNPQFRRGYRWFPPPGNRKAPMAGGFSSDSIGNNSGADYSNLERTAQELAARWGLAT